MPTKSERLQMERLLVYSPSPVIDHVQTGANAREYRESKRVRLREVADQLTSPHGTPITVANLHNYEAGKQCWTPEFLHDYVRAVDNAVKQPA